MTTAQTLAAKLAALAPLPPLPEEKKADEP